jgi:hypothetical protein
MTDKLPPIGAGKLRVIVHDDVGRMVEDFPVEHLPGGIDGLPDPSQEIMTKHTVEGAMMARVTYLVARKYDNSRVACAHALWICVFGQTMVVPGVGISMGDLCTAPGTGTIEIRSSQNDQVWEFVLTNAEGRVGGRVQIEEPGWAQKPAGSA